MERVFDITSFGAIGDGKTDCTKAVQSAIDAASSCMGKVVVPPGIYMVGHIHMYGQGISLVGSSAWSFRSDGASIFKLNTADTDCMIDISGAFGCKITGMSINGSGLGENIHGIKIYWDKYNGGSEEDTPTIDDCRVGGFTGDGLHFEHVWCFSVRHSMMWGNRKAGLFIDGWDAFIIDNWFTGNGGAGIMGGNVVASITCTGNRVEWNERGGFVIPSGDSYNITGNFFDRTFGPALELGGDDSIGVDLVTVTGNIFRRNGAYNEKTPFENPDMSSHMRLTNCSNITVTGNTMRVGRNDGDSGVTTPNYAFIISDCKYCIVKDNTMARGSLVQNVVERNNKNCIVDSNIGEIADPKQTTASPLLN